MGHFPFDNIIHSYYNTSSIRGINMKIEIYGRDGCPYCDHAKAACQNAGLPYTFHYVGREVTKDEVQTRINSTGATHEMKTVPQIFVDDKWVGGYDRLVATFPWAKVYNESRK